MSTYGNLKYDFTFPASNPSGSLVLIKSITASASASISFVNGSGGVVLDSTYKAYKFVSKNIHPSNVSAFTFQGSTNGGSSYGVTTTTTGFQAYHNEAGTGAGLVYEGSTDLAQSTSYITLNNDLKNDNDNSICSELWLFNPSSTTYVKHFMGRTTSATHNSIYFVDMYTAGYFNTTSAVDAIDFKMSSGNIDDGTISLYGLA